MTADDLAAIRDQQVKLTGRLCVALAEALLDVLAECAKKGPTEEEFGGGSSFVLGYQTAKRVVASVVERVNLP